jgi:putative membrane protein
VPDDDREPDYRFTLANERTFLAWIRTSLALLAGGVAVDALAETLSSGVRTTLAVAAVGLSLVLTAASYLRWRRVQDAMRAGRALPHPYAVPLLATGVVVVAGAVAVVLVAG